MRSRKQCKILKKKMRSVAKSDDENNRVKYVFIDILKKVLPDFLIFNKIDKSGLAYKAKITSGGAVEV